MCGIAGIFNINGEKVSISTLRRMTDIQKHRGPDGEGFFSAGFIGLGHRRLAVIDLTPAAHQPMANDDNTIFITYSGETYNFRSLRVELEALGCKFRSNSDSEVVLKAYQEWGPDCLHRFNGMFAFAIWDKNKSRLFLARDRYGIKPLYYYFKDNRLIFASEIKAILEHPAVSARICKKALLEYVTFQNILSDRTLFKDIKLLPSGCSITVQLGDPGSFTRKRYWDYDFQEPASPLPEEEYINELDRLFQQAVKRQLVSDVPVGAQLSGGIDSASITSVAARNIPYLSTFTAGFDLTSASGLELSFDERAKAEQLSNLYKTEQYEVVLKAGDMERVMKKLIWHLEDPRVGQCYPNFYVNRLASKFVKVLLCGSGGDELFAGYPWRYFRVAGSPDSDSYIEKYYRYWHRLLPNHLLKDMFQPDLWEELSDYRTIDVFRSVFGDKLERGSRPVDYINKSLYFESKTFLHGLFLVEDKLSMAHGLEIRVPFMDNDLVDFAMRIPVSMKLDNLENNIRVDENLPGYEKAIYKSSDGKKILRKALSRLVPGEIINQDKQGFSAPDASWFKGESIEYINNLLVNKDAMINDFFNPAMVKKLISDHVEGRANRRLLIWSLLSFEWWCRIFLK